MVRSYLHTRRGFTLVEVMVVVALVGIIAGVLIENMSTSLKVARDARRKSDMRKLQAALATYYARNGNYPVAPGPGYDSELGDPFLSNNSGNWIPGLAPVFIPKLPHDPKPGPSTNLGCTPPTRVSGYIYRSDDGSNYKLMAFCSAENLPVSNTDIFYDPIYPTNSWMVCSGEPACSY